MVNEGGSSTFVSQLVSLQTNGETNPLPSSKGCCKESPGGFGAKLDDIGDHGNTLLTASFALHKRRAKEQCALPSTRRGNMRNVNNVGGNNTGKLYI